MFSVTENESDTGNKLKNSYGMIIGYIRVSTQDQTVENQRLELSKHYKIDKWFVDEGLSGRIKASDREGCRKMLEYIRESDTVVVSAIDRLGRDTIDVLNTVKMIESKEASLISIREGLNLATPFGKAMLGIICSLAELEYTHFKARQMAGIERARKEGKRLGRKKRVEPEDVYKWRTTNKRSIKQTAKHFNVSITTIKNACKQIKEKTGR